MAAGDTGSVEMGKVIDVVPNGGDDIPFHDLHVVNVVEEPESGMVEFLTEFNAPVGVVALVVGVINPWIEEFHDENNIVLFRQGKNSLQSGSAVFTSLPG